MSESMYPELHEYMQNLLAAGLMIDRVRELGLKFALDLAAGEVIPSAVTAQNAAKMLKTVCNELGIGNKAQKIEELEKRRLQTRISGLNPNDFGGF